MMADGIDYHRKRRDVFLKTAEQAAVFNQPDPMSPAIMPATRPPPWQRNSHDGRRHRLLPQVPRGVSEATGASGRVQHAGSLGMSVRLRAVSRSRAAFVLVAGRDHRPLQPPLSYLL